MRPGEEEWYIGIELGSRFTMASYYRNGMKEPETKGLVAGSQIYRIPTAICKKNGIGQWYLGEEAEKLAENQEGTYIDHLLEKAVQGKNIEVEAEETYEAIELLQVFLRKVMRMVLPGKGVNAVTRCVFTVEQATADIAEVILALSQRMGLKREQMLIQDNRESFYAYAVSQEAVLWMYDVVLFSCENEDVSSWMLTHDKKTIPQISAVTEKYLGELPKESSQRDKAFQEMIQETLGKKMVSAVYLAGEGFEGEWMKESLQMLCRGRRAFQGRNLYTKGACYAGVMDAHPEKLESIYFCDYKTRRNIFLKASRKDREYMYPLVEAGKNIYQIEEAFQLLLEGEPALDIWLQNPDGKEAVIESLELEGLIPAEDKACRLGIQINGEPEGRLLVRIKDIGLGEIRPGSNQEWEYEVG